MTQNNDNIEQPSSPPMDAALSSPPDTAGANDDDRHRRKGNGRVKRGGPVGTARLALALTAGKMAGSAGRRLHIGGGTSLPGVIARRIDPKALRKVVGRSGARKIVVCGSNGKTTLCRMLAALAEASGQRLTLNRSGSNLTQGITASVVNDASVFGALKADLMIFEVDEATLRETVPEIEPDVVIVNNLFRDQLDRYGSMANVAAAVETMIRALPVEAIVALNGDDPLLANFAPDARARRIYFGLRTDDVGATAPEYAADSIRCPRCHHDLVYARAYLSHLGDYHCPACGYTRPPLDVAVTQVALDPQGAATVTLATPLGEGEFRLPLAGLHNVYNAAAAVAGALALELNPAVFERAFGALRPAFGRLEHVSVGEKQIVLAFVKNPASYNATLRTVLLGEGAKHLLVAQSVAPIDGEDFSWLWDVDIEALAPHLGSLTLSGSLADALAARFKYAGAPEPLIHVEKDIALALDSALEKIAPGETLYALGGNTPLHALRDEMRKRGWVSPFWKD